MQYDQLWGKRMKYAISLLFVVLSCGVSRADDVAATMSLEDRLQPGAITLTVSDFAVPPANSALWPTATFSLENKSGIALAAAVLSYGYSAGPCSLSPGNYYNSAVDGRLLRQVISTDNTGSEVWADSALPDEEQREMAGRPDAD